MNNKKNITQIVPIVMGLLLLAGMSALKVNAQLLDGINSSTNAGIAVGASGSGVNIQANLDARLSKIINQGDTAIMARITNLGKLNTRVQEMVNVSDNEKTNISNEVQTNANGLSNLKAKIDADIDLKTTTSDYSSIFGSFRIYALVIPQGYIEASSDRIDTIVNMFTTISTKLQARITADQSAGKDTATLQASLNDLNAKIADAKIQAGIAFSGVASLTPDNGNKTVFASNITALKSARANIKVATGDLQTARQDAKTIIQNLYKLDVNASATVSQ
jgi:hypothetical protein